MNNNMTQSELIDQLIKKQNLKREKIAPDGFLSLLAYGFITLFLAFLTAIFVIALANEADYQNAKAKAYQEGFKDDSNRDLVVRESSNSNKLGVAR